jgi:hypothetical protein
VTPVDRRPGRVEPDQELGRWRSLRTLRVRQGQRHRLQPRLQYRAFLSIRARSPSTQSIWVRSTISASAWPKPAIRGRRPRRAWRDIDLPNRGKIAVALGR